ncbi:MAG: diaminopimelate decarboxylase [Acidobacteria bacterium]|nr:diaminopimelate decarboxylase [Acidobacteriota bacterium]
MAQNWEIENFLEIRNGRLHIDGIDAVELARKYGTPLFVYSEPRIRHNIARLKQVGDNVGSGFKLCYAAKAMSTLGVLRAVRDAGCDLEVNSGGELWKAFKAGFRGDQLNFNGLSKEVWEIELAIENDVYAIQVDSLYELSLIEETAKRLGKKANVSLRLVPGIESATHSGLQTAMLTSKFGMMPGEAFGAFAKYKDSAHLNLCGVHLHVGSQNPSPAVYTQAFSEMFGALLRIFRETGIRLQHINLGGGFPVNYLRDRSQAYDFPAEKREMFAADFEPAEAMKFAWAEVRKKAEAENVVDLLEGITLLLEPGRSIIADAAICLTTVRNHKQRPVSNGQRTIKNGQRTMDNGQWTTDVEQRTIDNDRSEKEKLSTVHYQLSTETDSSTDHWLLTDAGFNILLSMETYKWYYHLISAERAGEPHETPYKLAGPLCDGGDVYFDIEGEGRLPDHRLLPENVEPGEILAMLNCGAYSLAQASQYNGRFLPPVVLTKADGTTELIRRRDTFEDLIANDL